MTKIKNLYGLIAAIVSGLIAFWIYSPMLNARLGLIDDHEFLKFLKVGGQNLGSLGQMLATTEVAHFGDTPRFRPAYYSLRALETVIHGTNGFEWYLWRVAMFALFIAGSTLLVFLVLKKLDFSSNLISSLVAGFFGMTLAAQRSWTDITMRLGPSELYLMLGILIFAYGAYYLLFRNSKNLGIALVTLGFWLAVGSKENSLSLVWVEMTLFVILAIRGFPVWRLLVAGFASLAMGGYVALGFLPNVLASGRDVYGAERSLSGWLGAIVAIPEFWLAITATALTLWIQAKTLSPDSAISKVAMFAFSISPLVLITTDAYFYQYSVYSSDFSPARYGVVIEAACLIALLQLAIWSRRSAVTRGLASTTPALISSLLLALIPGSAIFASGGTYAKAGQNAEYLNYQYQAIESVAQMLDDGAASQVLYISDEPYDYERINASRQFFDVLAVRPTKYFLWTDYSQAAIDQTTLPLAQELQTWSQSGNSDWEISPISELNQGAGAICVHFGQEPSSSPCSQSIWIGG